MTSQPVETQKMHSSSRMKTQASADQNILARNTKKCGHHFSYYKPPPMATVNEANTSKDRVDRSDNELNCIRSYIITTTNVVAATTNYFEKATHQLIS